MAQVALRKIVKMFDKTPAVQGIDLDIADREFIVLVGPSGCGKSTTLRMVAGRSVPISRASLTISSDGTPDTSLARAGVHDRHAGDHLVLAPAQPPEHGARLGRVERQEMHALVGDHHELRRVERVSAFAQDLALRATLAVGVHECRHVLKVVCRDVAGERLRGLQRHTIAREDAGGTNETIAYYCDTCHVHDDARRGRLLGHDGSHVVDTLRFQTPASLR